jgi:apolipoprotein N-acyltransferase
MTAHASPANSPVWSWRVSRLTGWRRAAVAFAAGSASVLAFAPWHLVFVLFATLPVLVWLIDGASGPRNAAVAGWWYGFGFFLFNLFWIGEAFLVEAEKFAWLLPLAVTLLPAGLALFWAGAAALCRRYWPAGVMRVLMLALVLTGTEWLRGHVLTGLPWNVIGYALTYPETWMQSASLVGAYALTLPAVLIFATPLVLVFDAKHPARALVAKALAAGALPLVVLSAYGAWRLPSQAVPFVDGVKLRIVQPSVPQREKWMSAKQAEIFKLHLDLTATSATGVRDDAVGVTHVIWPEAAMPFLPLEHPEALAAIANVLPPGAMLLSGAIRREIDAAGLQRGYNSILAFNSDGKVTATYDKVHLVPFGEYLPLSPVLSALGLSKLTQGLGAFDVGPWPRPTLQIAGLPPAGGLICYEVLFPGRVVNAGQRPRLLVNVTNDGWFGDTSGPRQHFHQTRVRAVEEGLPIVRAANNGISALIDPYGRVLAFADLDIKGVIDTGLPEALPPGLYAQAGDAILLTMMLISLAMLVWRRH